MNALTQHLFLSSALIIAGNGLCSGSAHARTLTESEQMPEHVQMTIATDFDQYAPGDTGLLAISLEMDKDWHTYWPGVSDTGYGVKLDFGDDASIQFDEPIWPSPHRYIQPGDILDHVYEETVMIIVPFQVSDSLQGPIDLQVKANYLVCETICLPGKADASMSINMVESSSSKVKSDTHDQIHKAFSNRPIPFDSSSPAVRLQWASNGVAVMFRDATKIEFYPDTDCTDLSDPIADGTTSGNRLIIKFDETENKILSGRLRVYENTRTIDYDVSQRAPEK